MTRSSNITTATTSSSLTRRSLRHVIVALGVASLFATGCVAAQGELAAGHDELDDTKEVIASPHDSLVGAIQAPVFYESNELGEVVGGPVPDFVSDEGFKNAGSRPIHIQKYGPFGNGGTLSTGFPTSNWIATVVGIDTTDGDINEVGVGNPLRAFPFQSNGIWNVTFDLRSHRDNESWSIWVMYVNRSMASATNF